LDTICASPVGVTNNQRSTFHPRQIFQTETLPAVSADWRDHPCSSIILRQPASLLEAGLSNRSRPSS